MIELKDRMRKLLEYKSLSIPKFAVAIGVKTPQAIREILNGKTKTLSDSMRSKILSYIPELNPVWLLAGDGEMILSQGNQFNTRSVSEVSKGGMATLGNQSPILRDVKIEIDEEFETGGKIPCDINKCQMEVKKLRALLTNAKMEISRLKGRIEEKDGFIKMLMEKK